MVNSQSNFHFGQASGSYFEKLPGAKIKNKKEKYLDKQGKILLQ
ncbi:hypothetical protein [Streptococcus mitis]